MIERVDQLAAPPIVGRTYLVPTVRGVWYGILRAWPVMGPKHEDAEFFRFPARHYHLDRRFLTDKITGMTKGPGRRHRVRRSINDAIGSPLAEPEPNSTYRPGYPENNPLPAPTLMRHVCRRADLYFPTHREEVRRLQDHHAGAACRLSWSGWVCPHRGFVLGSIAPDTNGVLTCPMHGLRIDAASGIVLPEPAAEKSRRKAARIVAALGGEGARP